MTLYMHDVWMNWFEGEENGYNVCEFHEWRKDDAIQVIDHIPLLYITEELFAYIANDMHNLPEDLLDKIYNKTYFRHGQKREVLEHAAIVTDGKHIIAFDTLGYMIPIRKSRLIPRQEKIVYNLIREKTAEHFDIDLSHYEKEYHILSLHPKYMIGLTRRERQLKQLLMISLDQLKGSTDDDELRYWLTEWQPENYRDVLAMDATEVWNTLYEEMKEGWSPFHEEILNKMVKGQPFLEKMWELEQEAEQNTLH